MELCLWDTKVFGNFMPNYQESAKFMEQKKGQNIIYIRQKFDDFELLKETASSWNLEFSQLDSGKFSGELMLLNMPEFQLSFSSFNRQFNQKGATPCGYRTFAIPADKHQSFRWKNHEVNGNNMIIFPESGELDAHSFPGFKAYTISIANDLIEDFINANESTDLVSIKDMGEVLELAPQSMHSIRRQINYMSEQIERNPELINKKAFQQIFTNDFPSLLLNRLINRKPGNKTPSQRIRDISTQKAVEYLNGCKSEMPSVTELCLISGASQRTLEYAFKDKFGFGPKEYMMKLLLNRVRQALKKANHEKVTVQVVAHRHGFLHMGQFSRDYKKLFGELPSETLKQ